MKILPVLREKKRYIAFEVISEQKVTRHELWEEISGSVRSLFGDKGAGEINAGLLSFDERSGLLRCERERTTEARAALACISRVRNGKVSINVLGISGTVRGATEKFIQQSLVNKAEPEKEKKEFSLKDF